MKYLEPFMALLFLLFLSSCSDGRARVVTVRPATALESQAEQDLAAKREQVARLAQDNEGKAKTITELNQRISAREQIITTAKADIVALGHDKQVMHEEQIAAVLAWTAGILSLIALAAAVAAWLLPLGKRTLISLAVIAGLLAPVALAAREYVHWLPLIGIVMIVIVVVIGLWICHRTSSAGISAASQLKMYANQLAELNPKAKEQLDMISLSMQGKGRSLLDALLQRAPDHSPERLAEIAKRLPTVVV